MTVLLNNSLTKATGDDRYLKLDGSNANTNIDIGAYTLTATSVIETTPTLFKLDQTTPQTVVPIAGTTFRLGYGDLIGDGTSLVFPRLEMTNSNVVEFPQTMGAIKDGLFIHGETDNTPILVFGGADVLSYKLGAVSYDTTDGVITINPDATADEHAYVSVQAITSPSGDAFPLLSGTGSTDEGLFFSNLLGIWDKEDTGQVGIVAVSNDWSSTSYMLTWDSATENLSYSGEGGFRVSTDGATSGTTATALDLRFKGLGDGADNDGIRIAFGHRSDQGILGTGYTAGYIDCIQDDNEESHMTSHIAIGGYTDGASAQWLKLDGSAVTVDVDLTLSSGTQDYIFSDRSTALTLQGQTSGVGMQIEYYSKDGDGTDNSSMRFYGVGSPTDITNRERIIIGWETSASQYQIYTEANGTGTLRPLKIYTEGSQQLLLNTDGTLQAGNATEYVKFDSVDFGGEVGSIPILSFVNTDFAFGNNIGGLADYLIIYDKSDIGYTTLAFVDNTLSSAGYIQCDHSTTTFYVDTDWCPIDDNSYDLGKEDNQWKDLRLAGTVYAGGYKSSDGTDGATADVAVAKVGGGTRTLHYKNGLYTGYTDS